MRAGRPRPPDGVPCVARESLVLTGIMAALAVGRSRRGPAPAGAPKDPAIRVLVVKTETEAREAVAQFNAGMAFDRIVRERSIGPERERGGYLGRVDPATLSPAARAAVARTRSGRLTPVFPTEGGFGVIQILTDQEEQELETQLRKEPEALALLKEGTDLGKRGDLDRAVPLLQRAVELNPLLADAHFNLAVGLVEARAHGGRHHGDARGHPAPAQGFRRPPPPGRLAVPAAADPTRPWRISSARPRWT